MKKVDLSFVSSTTAKLVNLKELASEQNKSLVVMLGKDGSRAYIHGKEYIQKANNSVKVIDTTGCGDTYQAAFVYYYFQGEPVESCMLKATEVATETLRHIGGYHR